MKRLVVIGGGISGLAAAWAAVQAAKESLPDGLDVIVLEREAEVGGKAQSLAEDGWLVEAGPTAWLGGEPAVDRLVRAAGLQDEVVAANAAAARRFVLRGGRLREIHTRPLKFAFSGVLGLGGLLRVLREPWVKPKDFEGDESVWSFARRRLGRQVADRLIGPMVQGVHAGNAYRLSLPAAFPRMAELEQEHGSLIRAMIALRKARRAGSGETDTDGDSAASDRPSGGPAGPGGGMFSFRDGLQRLPRALASKGGFTARCNVAVSSVEVTVPDRWRVETTDGEMIPADAVVLAGEPWAMAPLLRHAEPRLADLLQAIHCPPVTVVALGYGPEALRKLPQGFGVLIPREERPRILGCLWDTHIFSGRSPEGSILVRAMAGGSIAPRFAELPPDDLATAVQEELAHLFALREPPVYRRVIPWPRAIPQYELGHLSRVQSIEAELSRRPGLHLAGNALHGIAFGKAAAAGITAGEQAVRALVARTAALPA